MRNGDGRYIPIAFYKNLDIASQCLTESGYHMLDEKSLTAYFNGLVLRRSAWSNNTDETTAIIPKAHCKEDCRGKSDIS